MKTYKIAILGAGKIGLAIYHTLQEYIQQLKTYSYIVDIYDLHQTSPFVNKGDILQPKNSKTMLHDKDIIVNCLPHTLNAFVRGLAIDYKCAYFDLSENMNDFWLYKEDTSSIKIPKAYIPHCGLAPGLVSIISKILIARELDNKTSLDELKIRVGALPVVVNNKLNHSLTWNFDGLIHEYCDACDVIENGMLIKKEGMSDIESFICNGEMLEAAHTSGGIGTLADTLNMTTNIWNASYKTLRYPDHFDKMKFLLNDLELQYYDSKIVKHIFEKHMKYTINDFVFVYIELNGKLNSSFRKVTYMRQFLPNMLNKTKLTAIENITARSFCIVLDTYMRYSDKQEFSGFIKLEKIPSNWIKRSIFNVDGVLP